jgi:RNA polymerase sigma-70 factor (ECF subfamily)
MIGGWVCLRHALCGRDVLALEGCAIEPTDEQLLEAWFKGEASAFASFYARHGGRIRGWLRSKGLSDADADEVTQDSFVRLHERLASYDPTRPALPWVFQVVRSAWFDRARRETRARARGEAWETARAAEAVAAGESGPIAFVGETERLGEALASLGPEQRHLVARRFADEAPYEALAQETGRSQVSLRKAVERALKTLRTRLMKVESSESRAPSSSPDDERKSS